MGEVLIAGMAAAIKQARPQVRIVGVEAGGEGLDTRRHGAPLATNARGILHGALSAVLHSAGLCSIAAGLQCPLARVETTSMK